VGDELTEARPLAGYVALELRRSIDEIDPQQALAAAVIEQAVEDGLHGSGELRDEARAWLLGPDMLPWAELAGVDPDDIRYLFEQKTAAMERRRIELCGPFSSGC
jgi:hypothetical protein